LSETQNKVLKRLTKPNKKQPNSKQASAEEIAREHSPEQVARRTARTASWPRSVFEGLREGTPGTVREGSSGASGANGPQYQRQARQLATFPDEPRLLDGAFFSGLLSHPCPADAPKASVAHVCDIIRSPQNGIKAEEIKWTGFYEWLAVSRFRLRIRCSRCPKKES